MPNTITLKGTPIRHEGVTDEAVTPGHLVELGGTSDVQKHSTQGGFAERAFALENDLVGDGIGDAYASGETVQYGIFPPGSEVYAWLAAGEDTGAVGAILESDGDGALRVHVPQVNLGSSDDIVVHQAVAVALEDIDNSASGAVDVRIKVRVI